MRKKIISILSISSILALPRYIIFSTYNCICVCVEVFVGTSDYAISWVRARKNFFYIFVISTDMIKRFCLHLNIYFFAAFHYNPLNWEWQYPTLPNRDYEYEIEISYNSLMILSQMLICNTLFGADLHNEKPFFLVLTLLKCLCWMS
jgi:hypothetical protein